MFICYYPPAEHAIMDDSSVAQMLGINHSEKIVLAGYSFNDPRQTFGLYYVITVCTLADAQFSAHTSVPVHFSASN
uniref:Transposase n=1 Tax=Globodera pallida TaxID=36090 RepID=A0A183C849_GLOPA